MYRSYNILVVTIRNIISVENVTQISIIECEHIILYIFINAEVEVNDYGRNVRNKVTPTLLLPFQYRRKIKIFNLFGLLFLCFFFWNYSDLPFKVWWETESRYTLAEWTAFSQLF